MNQADFTALVEQHKKLIHKVAYAYCRNAADRDDVVQEIVVQLWRSGHKYDSRFKQSTWVYRIALNVAISFFRRERRHSEQRQEVEGGLISIAEDPGHEPEELQVLQHCIADLDELNKALVLLYLDGNDHATTAEVLGITVTNVATKLSRIKQKLRSAFAERSAT